MDLGLREYSQLLAFSLREKGKKLQSYRVSNISSAMESGHHLLEFLNVNIDFKPVKSWKKLNHARLELLIQHIW